MNIRKITCLTVALVMVLALVPFSVFAEAHRTVPEGYAENEYLQLAAFMELEDENGVKNGVKLNEAYDVNDPSTWGDGWLFFPSFAFDDELSHVMSIGWDGREMETRLVGALDIHGFTELSFFNTSWQEITSIDASDCPQLSDFDCSHCTELTELDISGCETLSDVHADNCALESINVRNCPGLTTSLTLENNNLTTLDVTGCPNLVTLTCSNNALTSIDLSESTALSTLQCFDNELEELDLSACTSLGYIWCYGNNFRALDFANCANNLNTLNAIGNGYVGCLDSEAGANGLCVLFAEPAAGETFLGWYDSSDQLLSEEAEWNIGDQIASMDKDLIAKFTENFEPAGLLGDVNHDGEVTMADVSALVAYLMNSGSLEPEGLANADANQDGTIDILDATAIYAIAFSN